MYIKKIIFIKVLLFLLSTIILNASIGGNVFQDLPVNGKVLNTYGTKDINEIGVEGIRVTAYPDNITTLTDSNGSWSLNTTQDSRIEFSNIPSYLKESVEGQVNNTSVQFISNNTNTVSFGLHNPADFSNTPNPYYVSNLQQNGTHLDSTLQNLQTVHYNASGLNKDFKTNTGVQGEGENPEDTILMDKLGSVWAKAYQKSKQRLFVTSMLQRHIGFANTPADIYVTDYSAGVPATLLGNFSLQDTSTANSNIKIDLGSVDRVSGPDYTLTVDPLLPNIDLDSYAKVGKISYGGADIDHNTDTLWLINLKQRGIISIDIAGDFSSLSAATKNQYFIKDLNATPTCKNGELRPWALKIHNDRGYVGAVCDASLSHSSDDLSAHVFSFDVNNPSAGFSQELNIDLNYSRQVQNWETWEDEYFDPTHPKAYNGKIYAQPILSDIEFDKSNNMYLAFFDRYATQIGTGNYSAVSGSNEIESAYEYGEVLKICNNNGTYEKESTGSCLKTNYSDLGISEFFNDAGGSQNRESSLGALAILKGSNQLLLTTVDPHPQSTTGTNDTTYWFTQGTHTLSTREGSIENWYSFARTSRQGLNSKANGLGDIELITAPAPIEIGNRVWFDANADGIQDNNESGIEDINITLICNNNIVATAKTDNIGNYLFSNDLDSISTTSHIYAISELKEGSSNCYISIPNTSGNQKQANLDQKTLTANNSGQGSNKTLNDSNAISSNTASNIIILASDIPKAGHNNHSFDIGFKPIITPPVPPVVPPVIPPVVPPVTVQLGDRVWLDENKDGIQDDNETGVANVTVNLYDNANCSGPSSKTTTTNNQGIYQFTNLSVGTYCIAFSDLPTEHNVTLENQGANDSLDSNANSSAQIENINLTVNDNSQDMGIYPTSAVVVPPVIPPVVPPVTVQLGDRVWLDENKDGIQDDNETGVANVTVNLYDNANCSSPSSKTTTTNYQGIYQFTNLSVGTYCIAFSDLPAEHNVTLENQGANDSLDSNANSSAQIENINLTINDNSQDMGIYPTSAVVVPPVIPPVVPPVTVQLGDRVWLENDNDGNATTGIVTPVIGQIVIATSSDGTIYSDVTDNNGSYLITVPQNDTYVITLATPQNYTPSGEVRENNISDNHTGNNISHDSTGTTVHVTTQDNLTLDFGFRLTDTLGITVCEEMKINDDTQAANDLNATTTIDVLANDTGSKVAQEIKFLPLSEGKLLWESDLENITSANTLDTLVVEGEGTWSIINNKIVFETLTSFDGKIPTPIYYIVKGTDCTVDTQFTNVAKVTINSPCYCPTYSTKSVSTMNVLSALVLILLTLFYTFLNVRNEIKL